MKSWDRALKFFQQIGPNHLGVIAELLSLLLINSFLRPSFVQLR